MTVIKYIIHLGGLSNEYLMSYYDSDRDRSVDVRTRTFDTQDALCFAHPSIDFLDRVRVTHPKARYVKVMRSEIYENIVVHPEVHVSLSFRAVDRLISVLAEAMKTATKIEQMELSEIIATIQTTPEYIAKNTY